MTPLPLADVEGAAGLGRTWTRLRRGAPRAKPLCDCLLQAATSHSHPSAAAAAAAGEDEGRVPPPRGLRRKEAPTRSPRPPPARPTPTPPPAPPPQAARLGCFSDVVGPLPSSA